MGDLARCIPLAPNQTGQMPWSRCAQASGRLPCADWRREVTGTLEGGIDDFYCRGTVLPAANVGVLPRLQFLVDVEEMPDLGGNVRGNVTQVLQAGDPGVMGGP